MARPNHNGSAAGVSARREHSEYVAMRNMVRVHWAIDEKRGWGLPCVTELARLSGVRRGSVYRALQVLAQIEDSAWFDSITRRSG
jgi:hypothetical protein